MKFILMVIAFIFGAPFMLLGFLWDIAVGAFECGQDQSLAFLEWLEKK